MAGGLDSAGAWS